MKIENRVNNVVRGAVWDKVGDAVWETVMGQVEDAVWVEALSKVRNTVADVVENVGVNTLKEYNEN